MKKRFVTILLAIVATLCLVFPFSACYPAPNNETGSTTEQGSTGNTNTSDSGNTGNTGNTNTPDGGSTGGTGNTGSSTEETPGSSSGGNTHGERLTDETQWKQAFADIMEAKTRGGSLTIKDRISTDEGVVLVDEEAIKAFDIKNHVLYLKNTDTATGSDQIIEQYYELQDKEVNMYGQSNQTTEGWYSNKMSCETAEIAAEQFEIFVGAYYTDASLNGLLKDVLTINYTDEPNGKAKELSEMFSAFTYDEITGEYVASLYLWIPSIYGEDINVDIDLKITFNGGKIAAYTADVIIDFISSENERVVFNEHRQVVCNYGADLTLTVPQEAKDAASVPTE